MPKFSPDGSRIAYLSDRHNFGGKKDIWVHDIIEGGDAQVTSGVPVSGYCWLSDGKSIVFTSGIDTLRLLVCDMVTKQRRMFMTSDTAKTFNEMSPRVTSLNGVEKVIYVREYEDGERRIHWVNSDGKEDRCIINSEKRDWLE
jgi:Tol biopolymer transport system component